MNVFSRRNDIIVTLVALTGIATLARTYLAGRALAAAAVIGEALDVEWEEES